MQGLKRREKIIQYLKESRQPLKGSELAERLGVSRQTLVGDIALLRKEGHPILSTIRGYRLEELGAMQHEVIGISHPPKRLERELSIIIAHHVGVKDVMIDHPVYGKVTADLNLYTPKDIRLFIERWKASSLELFSEWTGGFHYHTLVSETSEDIEAAIEHLIAEGFPVERT
ncbi:MAG: transcription repressor NadR [Candidatus Carbobacillus altaicus]|nr:transcription repressor NadR [Candidatus Carbobacillus altaicus]